MFRVCRQSVSLDSYAGTALRVVVIHVGTTTQVGLYKVCYVPVSVGVLISS